MVAKGAASGTEYPILLVGAVIGTLPVPARGSHECSLVPPGHMYMILNARSGLGVKFDATVILPTLCSDLELLEESRVMPPAQAPYGSPPLTRYERPSPRA